MKTILLNYEMQLSINFSIYGKLNKLVFPCNSFEVLYGTRNRSIMTREMSNI